MLSELVRYTEYQFSNEAQLMRRRGVSDEAGHLKAHDEFVAKMQREKAGVEAGQTEAASDLLTYLRDWLVNHILRTDLRLARELNAKGVV